MKLTVVNYVPERAKSRHSLRMVLEEFTNMDATVVMIDPIAEGYKHPKTLYGGLANAVVHFGYPIKVSLRKGKVYLEKMI